MFPTNSLPKKLYLVGVVFIFLAVYSQYVIRYGSITGYLVVYGIPVLVVSLLFGRQLLHRAGKNNKEAAKFGLGLFGVLTVLSLFLSIIALAIIVHFYPHAANLLNKPNPVLNVSSNVAWVMIPVSILVVGPAEEYLFRGFIYGGLLSISKGKYWIPLAVVSSGMFASVHAYYGITYGIASVLPFIDLITFGLAMSITYYWSGGNILVLALIHGVYDATDFLGVATTSQIGQAAQLVMIFVCIGFAAVYLPKKIVMRQTTNPSVPPETTPETQPPPDPPQM
ncbi:MAG: type II CAAX endopeptidase family protein [Candidatus Bathyarchaeia archaeon]|jgi:membrane protease YdiL (CAAX protease family)